jgi:hypothetical protein
VQQDSRSGDAAALGFVRTNNTSSQELRHVKGHVSGRVREESQHAVRASCKPHTDGHLARDHFEHKRTRDMNSILETVYSEERRIGKHYCSARSQFLEAYASLVKATMKIDKGLQAGFPRERGNTVQRQ